MNNPVSVQINMASGQDKKDFSVFGMDSIGNLTEFPSKGKNQRQRGC
jgi:hypothetical protein